MLDCRLRQLWRMGEYLSHEVIGFWPNVQLLRDQQRLIRPVPKVYQCLPCELSRASNLNQCDQYPNISNPMCRFTVDVVDIDTKNNTLVELDLYQIISIYKLHASSCLRV